MATITKIFKPRRGKTTSMVTGSKKDTVLAKGEMFVEYPDEGPGTGPCKIMIGDGTSSYSTLATNNGYALGDNASTEKILFTESNSTSVTDLVGNTGVVVSGQKLSNIIPALKKAAQLNASAISTLSTNISNGTIVVNNASTANYSKNGASATYASTANYAKNTNIKFNVASGSLYITTT